MTYVICVSLAGFVCFFSFILLLYRNVAMKIRVSGLQGYAVCLIIDGTDEAVLCLVCVFFSPGWLLSCLICPIFNIKLLMLKG